MRRVATVLVILTLAMLLVACGGTATTGTNGTAGSANASGTAASNATSSGAGVVNSGGAGSVSNDVMSPVETVNRDERLVVETATVPASLAAAITAHRPVIIYYYDSTTNAASNQRREIDAAVKKYRGMIDLFAFDYTVGLKSSDTSATLDSETQKMELLATSLRVSTTPYLLFVDSYGRITYRFAGYTDRVLIEREILRATQ